MEELKTRTGAQGFVLNYTNNTAATQFGGQPVRIGNWIGSLLIDVAVGDTVGAQIYNNMNARKDATVFKAGDKVFFDETATPLDGVAASGAAVLTVTSLYLGEATEPASATDETVFVLLNQSGPSEIQGGLIEQVLEEDVVIPSAVASVDLSKDIPDGAIITSIAMNNQTLITGAGGGVKVGLGVAADPDKYGLSADLVKNTKVTLLVAEAILSGAEDIKIFATDGAGAAAGTLDTGTVRVRITYTEKIPLPDAA